MEQEKEENKDYDLKIPPGTPEDIVASAKEKFKLKLIIPQDPEHSQYYMALRGKKDILIQAHDYIRDLLEERVKKFEKEAKGRVVKKEDENEI